MKKIKVVLLVIIAAVLFSVVVFSQLAPITNIVSKVSQATPAISLEETDTCIASFYDEIQAIYENCIYYRNITSCLNTTGSNTDCSTSQEQINFSCKTGEVTVAKNRTECKPNDKFIISIDQGTATLKKQLDYSEWGPCIYNAENNCLIVTCQSRYDGAHKGQFTDCNGGKSCQKFLFCKDETKVFYKNSRNDFVEEDPTFYLSKLALKEMTK